VETLLLGLEQGATSYPNTVLPEEGRKLTGVQFPKDQKIKELSDTLIVDIRGRNSLIPWNLKIALQYYQNKGPHSQLKFRKLPTLLVRIEMDRPASMRNRQMSIHTETSLWLDAQHYLAKAIGRERLSIEPKGMAHLNEMLWRPQNVTAFQEIYISRRSRMEHLPGTGAVIIGEELLQARALYGLLRQDPGMWCPVARTNHKEEVDLKALFLMAMGFLTQTESKKKQEAGLGGTAKRNQNTSAVLKTTATSKCGGLITHGQEENNILIGQGRNKRPKKSHAGDKKEGVGPNGGENFPGDSSA
jgi:hypothetical protein